MCFKLKPLSLHIVNGSTLMAFGLAVLFVAFNVLEISSLSWGLIGIGSAIWFLFLGVYEFAIAVRFREFFDEDCRHYHNKEDIANNKEASKHDKKGRQKN